MSAMCGMDNCCVGCSKKEECGGCTGTEGRPFGGEGMCVAAECVRRGGAEELQRMKNTLINEFNSLGIRDLHIDNLNLLNGFYVNLEYPLPNGQTVKLLEDKNIYWGNQIERPGDERCYGIIADEHFLLVCEYGCEGASPELLLYKKR